MANNDKKFYWLKLKRDFFKRHDMRIIEKMPNGKEYSLFYLKLLCESVDHNGLLRFSDTIPYTEEMLATITDTNPEIAKEAIELFYRLELIEIMDDGTFYMTNLESMLGSSSQDEHAKESTRLRVKAYRERKEQAKAEPEQDCNSSETLQGRYGNVTVTLHDCYGNVTCNGEKEKDIEIEKEKETDIYIHSDECIPARETKHRHGEYKKILLTDKEYEKLVTDYGQELTEKAISYVDEYIARKGAKYKSHYLVIKKWGIDAVKEQQAKRSTNKTAQSLDEFYDMAASWAESEAHDGT